MSNAPQDQIAQSTESQLELGSIIVRDNVTLHFIRKPNGDIVFTLREIDDKVS
jgi:hypothetical protein